MMPQKKSQRFDSERETRVLMEEVRSELRVVAGGHGLIIGRLDKVEGRLDRVENDLQGVKDGFQGVKGKLTQHDQRFDRIDGQLSQLQQQVGTVLTDHESRLKVPKSLGVTALFDMLSIPSDTDIFTIYDSEFPKGKLTTLSR